MVKTVHTKTGEAQARLNFNMKMGVGHESPSLTVELLLTVSLWERERQISLRM